ncbi:hypothetical protein [Phaeovulum sp.]|uniref:hypothetical protein n=1 Tax=Phaeovulum sp. TaxID=2934796 RepID=UPI0035670CB0
MSAEAIAGTQVSEAAIGTALAEHLRRCGAIAVQLRVASAAECAEALRHARALAPADRLVVLAPADLLLPGEAAPIRVVRLSFRDDTGPSASEIAAALDCLPRLDAAIILVFLGPMAVPLPKAIAQQVPDGARFADWLATSLGDATCGGGAAG